MIPLSSCARATPPGQAACGAAQSPAAALRAGPGPAARTHGAFSVTERTTEPLSLWLSTSQSNAEGGPKGRKAGATCTWQNPSSPGVFYMLQSFYKAGVVSVLDWDIARGPGVFSARGPGRQMQLGPARLPRRGFLKSTLACVAMASVSSPPASERLTPWTGLGLVPLDG